MRHNKNFNHLGRQAGHRKALMSNMASSLILHKRIETTVAKAKAVRQFIEPLVTKSKDDSTHSRRIVFSYLKQKEAVTELFRTIAPQLLPKPSPRRAVRASPQPRRPMRSRRLRSWKAKPRRPHLKRLPLRRLRSPRLRSLPRLQPRRLPRKPT